MFTWVAVAVDHTQFKTADGVVHVDHPTPATHPILAGQATFPGHETFQVEQGVQSDPAVFTLYPQAQALQIGVAAAVQAV